jgi:hypothetical protein
MASVGQFSDVDEIGAKHESGAQRSVSCLVPRRCNEIRIDKKESFYMNKYIVIAALLVLIAAVFFLLNRFIVARTGTAVAGCEAARVNWTEAMQYFFMIEMMDSPPTALGRDSLKLDSEGRVKEFGINNVEYDATNRIITIGGANVTYDVNGRASSVGINDLQYDDSGRIIKVGQVPILYENDRVIMIGDACARYDDTERVAAIGWDPILYGD